jgi:eukaryotic-like serine/threonine-protein kinase
MPDQPDKNTNWALDAEKRERLRESMFEDATALHDQSKAKDDGNTASYSVPQAEHKSRTIGPFQLRIGIGGMGEVWMAEQEKPVRRKVALKLIKAGMDTKEVVARFEAERQALAMMDHQNIAKVLDAGTTEDGRPYFVMELVNGIPITQYCDQNKLDIDRRLGLFMPVCKAVQHAHQKGIIHRDLKPSNILVTLYDGQPVPKVIDFGLAKALQHQNKLTDKTLFTEFGQVVGTLQYMSPEQAEMNALDIDTRTDIYALGVLLYELLTGSTPIDNATIKNQAVFKVLESIRDLDPPRPSTRLSASGDAVTGISQQRQIEPRKLSQLLRGDLDWIVMKALEKDRTRRYETANGFAADVQRFLSGDAIEARPPSTSYRLKKFIRRNRAKVLLGSSTVIVLLIATGVSTVFGFLAIAASKKAESAKIESQASAFKAIAEKSKADDALLVAEKESEASRVAKIETDVANQNLRSTLARTNLLLAQSRWDAKRPGDARRLLDSIPNDLRGFDWKLARRQFEGSYATLHGHSWGTIHMVGSQDGHILASASVRDESIKIWNAKNGKLAREIKVDSEGGIIQLALDSDGKNLFVLGSRKILVWNFDREQWRVSIEGSDKEKGFRRFAVRHDGNEICTLSWGGEISLWDTGSGSVKTSIGKHRKRSNGGFALMSYSPCGNFLATVSEDMGTKATLEVVDVRTPTKEPILSVPSYSTCTAFSPDSRFLASGDYKGGIVIWDWDAGKAIKTIDAHSSSVTKLAFSPDGLTLASNSFSENTVKVWDINAGTQKHELIGHEDGLGDIFFSENGARLLTSSVDGSIKFWDILSGSNELTLAGLKTVGEIILNNLIAFSPDGKHLASLSSGDKSDSHKILKKWSSNSGELAMSIVVEATSNEGIAFSKDGNSIFLASPSRLGRYKASIGEVEWSNFSQSDFFEIMVLSPDGKSIATLNTNGLVHLWNSESGALEAEYPQKETPGGMVVPFDSIDALQFTPDSSTLVLSSPFREGIFINLATGEQSQLPSLFGRLLYGRHTKFASISNEKVKITNVESNQGMVWLTGHKSKVTDIAFSPDERFLVSAADNELKLWNTVSSDELLNIKCKSPVKSIQFSPDGTYFATASEDGSIVIWNTWQEATIVRLSMNENALLSLSRNGDLLAIAEEKQVRLLDTKSLAELFCFEFDKDRPWARKIAFDEASSRLFVGHSHRQSTNAQNESGKDEFVADDLTTVYDLNSKAKSVLPSWPDNVYMSNTSEDHQLVAMGFATEVWLVDTTDRSGQRQTFRNAKVKVNSAWHLEQARKAELGGNGFAEAFHRAALRVNSPNDLVSELHFQIAFDRWQEQNKVQKLDKSMAGNEPQQSSSLPWMMRQALGLDPAKQLNENESESVIVVLEKVVHKTSKVANDFDDSILRNALKIADEAIRIAPNAKLFDIRASLQLQLKEFTLSFSSLRQGYLLEDNLSSWRHYLLRRKVAIFAEHILSSNRDLAGKKFTSKTIRSMLEPELLAIIAKAPVESLSELDRQEINESVWELVRSNAKEGPLWPPNSPEKPLSVLEKLSIEQLTLLRLAADTEPKLLAKAALFNTLGIAHYRNEEYQLAIQSLTRSVDLIREETKVILPGPSDSAFLGLSHWKLGNKEEAVKYRNMFDEAMKRSANFADPDNQAFRREIEETFGQ